MAKEIFCNFYAPEMYYQPGIQPVRVFCFQLRHAFQFIQKELAAEDNSIDYSKLSFFYGYGPYKPRTPKLIGSQIQFDESFLSFLWGMCYFLAINFAQTKREKTDKVKMRHLFDYIVSLWSHYTEWDKEYLPNPEYYPQHLAKEIESTGIIYLLAQTYILYHEFGHFHLKHMDKLAEVPFEKRIGKWREFEIEADCFAAEKLIWHSKHNDDAYFAAKVAIVSAIFSMIMVDKKPKSGILHPDLDIRLMTVLEHLGLDENDGSWAYAIECFILWQIEHDTFIGLPEQYKSYKQYFKDIRSIFEEYKKTGKLGFGIKS